MVHVQLPVLFLGTGEAKHHGGGTWRIRAAHLVLSRTWKDGAFWGKAHFLDMPVLAFPTARPSLLKLPEPPEIAVPAGGPVLNTWPSGDIL